MIHVVCKCGKSSEVVHIYDWKIGVGIQQAQGGSQERTRTICWFTAVTSMQTFVFNSGSSLSP